MSSAAMDLQNQERSQMDGYYTLDTWSKSNLTMAPPPALPGGYKRGHVKPKKSKLRWYLVFGLSVLITAVVVVVVALVVHFTTSKHKEQLLQDRYLSTEDTDHDVDHPHNNQDNGHVDNPPRMDTTTRRTDHKPTNGGSLLHSSSSQTARWSSVDATTSVSAYNKTTQQTTEAADQTKLPSTSKVLVNSSPTLQSSSSQNVSAAPTTGFVPVIPTDKLVESDTSISGSQTFTASPSTTTKSDKSSVNVNVSAPIHHLNSTSKTSHVTVDATTPAFIRDHSGDIPTTTKDVTLSTYFSSSSDVAKIIDDASTTVTTANTDTQPRVMLESVNVTLASKSISLLFEAINVPDWEYLQIFRSEEDGGIGDVVAMVTAGHQHPILDIYDQNFRSQISFKSDALAVTLQTDVFKCNQTTNFTSVFGTQTTTYLNVTTVYVIQEPPTMRVPQAIVEGRNMTMTCSVELFGSNGRLVWKFRPPGINMYFDLSSSHKTTQEWNNCTTTINSTLMFTPQSHDNGSYFRCEIVDADFTVPSDQILHQDTEFLVVPKTFCQDKRNYTVHPHPYHPCNLVVYCFQTGPLVYHINCSPGTCYDKNKTKCVPIE